MWQNNQKFHMPSWQKAVKVAAILIFAATNVSCFVFCKIITYGTKNLRLFVRNLLITYFFVTNMVDFE